MIIRLSSIICCALLLSACGGKAKIEPQVGAETARKTGSWHCSGAKKDQPWRCVEAEGPPPKVRFEPPKEPVKKAEDSGLEPRDSNVHDSMAEVTVLEPDPEPQDELAPQRASAVTVMDWREQPDEAYVVQLISARQQTTIDAYRERYRGISDQLVEVIEPDTGMWVQFLGFFTTREDAKSAAAALAPDAESPWIRQLGALKSYLDVE